MNYDDDYGDDEHDDDDGDNDGDGSVDADCSEIAMECSSRATICSIYWELSDTENVITTTIVTEMTTIT